MDGGRARRQTEACEIRRSQTQARRIMLLTSTSTSGQL
jgi:hypothetical protein